MNETESIKLYRFDSPFEARPLLEALLGDSYDEYNYAKQFESNHIE